MTPPDPSAPPAPRHDGALARLGRASARRPWRVIAAWIVAAVAIGVGAQTFGGTLVDQFTIPNSDAQRATDLLTARFPAKAGDAATAVFAVPSGRLDAPARRQAVVRALAAAKQIPGVTSVDDPYAKRSDEIAKNGRIGYANIQFDRQAFDIAKADVQRLEDDVAAAVAGSGVQAELTGQVIVAATTADTGSSELIGVGAAIVILLIVFGTAVAMAMPIMLAIFALGIGLSLITLAAALTNFNTITPVLATMLGLGIGIDYALVIVTRFRQALHDGSTPEDAAAIATATAGRAVIFAGTTVAIAISALAVVGLDFVTKLGFGAAITVVAAVIAAITLLPAVLRLVGHRIDRWRVPFLRQRDDSRAAQRSSAAGRWGRFVTSHAKSVTAVALIVLGLLASPLIGLHLGSSDAGSNPPDTTTRKAYDLLAEGFGPGFNGPLLVAVDQAGAPGTASRLATAFRSVHGVASVPAPIVNSSRDTAQVVVYPSTAPDSTETEQLVSTLRDTTIPAALAGSSAKAFVGGSTAAFEDISKRISQKLPLFLLVAGGITFLLLSMAFRSVVIAVKAALTTLLSAAAAFGVLVAVFQFGWGSSLIGLDTTGPIESFLPVIVFALLLGLSMDYEVFLVSRIREEYVHGDAPRPAIVGGVAAIGRVIVAAAAIMATVFFSFGLSPDRTTKEFGIALGAAVLIDAFVVRLALVPAIMYLLNEKAWFMPRWLDRVLPRLTIESPTEADDDESIDANGDGGVASPRVLQPAPTKT
jgi:RND superfamily putative drug exporter